MKKSKKDKVEGFVFRDKFGKKLGEIPKKPLEGREEKKNKTEWTNEPKHGSEWTNEEKH